MRKLSEQLEIFGLTEVVRRIEMEPVHASERRRLLRRVEVTHEMMTALPAREDLSFLHSGFCQTCLPHSRPLDDRNVWRRSSGRFTLIVSPGVVEDNSRGGAANTTDGIRYVGVPYGTRARLIMIYLQTEGLKGRQVSLGKSLTAFLRSLGLPNTGGPRGSIMAVREQSLRIARCNITMQWKTVEADGIQKIVLSDTRIVDGLELSQSAHPEDWAGEVQLSERFYEHLKAHAVPLDKRAIAHLSGNNLGLDLYTLFAYRLPKLSQDLHLNWASLQSQIGSNEKVISSLAQRVKEAMPDVLTAYPHANIEVGPHGLLLKPSKSAVPKTTVQGLRIYES